jgi:hypothetical protein
VNSQPPAALPEGTAASYRQSLEQAELEWADFSSDVTAQLSRLRASGFMPLAVALPAGWWGGLELVDGLPVVRFSHDASRIRWGILV